MNFSNRSCAVLRGTQCEGAEALQLCDVAEVGWGGQHVVQGEAFQAGKACGDVWEGGGAVQGELEEMVLDDRLPVLANTSSAARVLLGECRKQQLQDGGCDVTVPVGVQRCWGRNLGCRCRAAGTRRYCCRIGTCKSWSLHVSVLLAQGAQAFLNHNVRDARFRGLRLLARPVHHIVVWQLVVAVCFCFDYTSGSRMCTLTFYVDQRSQRVRRVISRSNAYHHDGSIMDCHGCCFTNGMSWHPPLRNDAL